MIIELEQKKLDEKFAAAVDVSIFSDEEVDQDYVIQEQQHHHHSFVEIPK